MSPKIRLGKQELGSSGKSSSWSAQSLASSYPVQYSSRLHVETGMIMPESQVSFVVFGYEASSHSTSRGADHVGLYPHTVLRSSS